MSVETQTPSSTSAVRPMIGSEYLESIRDGRENYCYGERVEDVTTHPAFRNGRPRQGRRRGGRPP
jgi:4-hydroxyphenylacetate 3-monooxygenase